MVTCYAVNAGAARAITFATMDEAIPGLSVAIVRRGEYDEQIKRLCAPIALRAFGSSICPTDDVYASCLVSQQPSIGSRFVLMRWGDIAHSFYARVVLTKGQSVETAFHHFQVVHGGARAERRSMAKTIAMCRSRGLWPEFTNRAAARAAAPGSFGPENVLERTAYVPLLIDCPTNLPHIALFWHESEIAFYDVDGLSVEIDAIVHENVFMASTGRRAMAQLGHPAAADGDDAPHLLDGIPLPVDHPAALFFNPHVVPRDGNIHQNPNLDPPAIVAHEIGDMVIVGDVYRPFDGQQQQQEYVPLAAMPIAEQAIPLVHVGDGDVAVQPPVRHPRTVSVIERSTVEWQFDVNTEKWIQARIEHEINTPATAVVVALHFDRPIDADEHPLRSTRLVLDGNAAYYFDAPMLEEINWQRCGLIPPTASYKFREMRQDFLFLVPFSREAFCEPPTCWINFGRLQTAVLRMELARADYGVVKVVLSAHTVEIRGYRQGMSGRHPLVH